MEIYTVKAAAEKLSIDVETLRRWLREGKISASKIGRVWRLTDKNLEDFLNKNLYTKGDDDK